MIISLQLAVSALCKKVLVVCVCVAIVYLIHAMFCNVQCVLSICLPVFYACVQAVEQMETQWIVGYLRCCECMLDFGQSSKMSKLPLC